MMFCVVMNDFGQFFTSDCISGLVRSISGGDHQGCFVIET